MFDPLRTKAKTVGYTAIAFIFGIGIASGLGWTESSLAMPVLDQTPQVAASAVAPATDLSDAFVNVADVVTPAVVRIEAEIPTPQAVQEMPQGFPPGFEDIFGNPQQPRGPRTAGGSGFVVSDDGYILTNNHVVQDASTLRVYFPNKEYVEAEFVGGDPLTDVAVIRIPTGSVQGTLSFADSDEVRVGEWILAIGNPGIGGGNALDYSVTAGIISAQGRNLSLLRQELGDRRTADGDPLGNFTIEDFLQTDAVINPGNSGGPMVDMSGRVIGINSAIASLTGYYQGYGFAIPINLARRVMEDLIEFGQVRRPQIGVQIDEVSPEDAEAYGLPGVQGALVQEVSEGGPAESAGLQQEDVIVAIDGETIGYVSQLQGKVAMYRPGDRVTVTIYRDGREQDITVRLGEAPINTQVAAAPVAEPDMVERLGIGVQELTAELARELQFAEAGGVVISEVQRGSPAFRRGIGIGARLLEINDVPIREVADVGRVLDSVEPGAVVRFLLGRADGGSRVVNVRMPS